MIPFEFIVDGPPVSQQTRRRDRLRVWKALVRQEAERIWPPNERPKTSPIFLKVTYYYEAVAFDVDNIVKPIQDAIIGLAYVDDDQITDVLVRKRDLSGTFRVTSMTPMLAAGFARGKEFLHIVVTDAPDQEVID